MKKKERKKNELETNKTESKRKIIFSLKQTRKVHK